MPKEPLSPVANFLAQHSDISIVELLMCDLNGILRGKWAPASSLEKAFSEGINFPYSLFGNDVWGREVMSTGLHIDTGDKDGFCIGIAHTLARSGFGVKNAAQLMLTMQDQDGKPFYADPRQLLQRQIDLLSQQNELTACAAFELEFYLFDIGASDTEAPKPVDQKPSGPVRQDMYDLNALERHAPLFEQIIEAAKLQDIPVDTIVSEAAPGQFEVNLKHRSDIMRAADDAVLLRRIISSCAKEHGLKASFMAKPLADEPGNGMHVHISMLDSDGGNIFAADNGLNLLHYAIAGTLQSMAETALVFANTINGFRRFQPGSYAPTRAVWGDDNRSVAVRVPAGAKNARRLEHRISGADANPYLVAATILAAMRTGLEAKANPPAAVTANAYDEDTDRLPSSAGEALRLFAASRFAAEVFTPLGHRVFCAIKQAELDEFTTEITPLERSTYA